MAERGDLARQAKTRRVDETQQVERQGGVFLEQVFDFGRAGLFAHQVDKLDDRGLRGADGGGLDQRGVGEPVALEQLDAQVTISSYCSAVSTFSAISVALLWVVENFTSGPASSGLKACMSSLMKDASGSQLV